MKARIQALYDKLVSSLGIEEQNEYGDINSVIRKSLHEFVEGCNIPAIWCMGKHTRMLMADFMNELKKVRFIIDNNVRTEDSGFKIITEDGIIPNGIDGIIISSYDFKEEIKENIKKKFPNIRYLDLYEEMERNGIIVCSNYFSAGHPYSRYNLLNHLQMELEAEGGADRRRNLYHQIIQKYVIIKDFKTASKYAEDLCSEYGEPGDNAVLANLKEIYSLQRETMADISKDNVVMLCFDGARCGDIIKGKMPNLLEWIERNAYFYDNARSVSTSTYESLIPTYSENYDLRTKYYEQIEIPVKNCRFVSEALAQNRKIYFYTDMDMYVKCDEIKRSHCSQTATEKMWDFMLDAFGEGNGLFYIHILYESHYSYPNPYTKSKIVSAGTNIMFDFLETKGGGLRTDYVAQQADALKYLDDVVVPLVELLNCRMVVYADHGNILLEDSDDLSTLDETKYTFNDDLLRVPLVIKSPEMAAGRDDRLISLMELSSIIVSLLNGTRYDYVGGKSVKSLRSQIYNPDFRYLYHKYNHDKCLQAFEVFIFDDGYKLAVYADGTRELYHNDSLLEDDGICCDLYGRIKDEITVCRQN